MPSIDQVQAGIISKLLAYTPLTAVVGNEIREDEWQGEDFVYPCVRVLCKRLVLTTDRCNWDLAFVTSSFDTDTSSKNVMMIGTLVLRALDGKNIQFGGLSSTKCYSPSIAFPYRTPNKTWRMDNAWSTLIPKTAFAGP